MGACTCCCDGVKQTTNAVGGTDQEGEVRLEARAAVLDDGVREVVEPHLLMGAGCGLNAMRGWVSSQVQPNGVDASSVQAPTDRHTQTRRACSFVVERTLPGKSKSSISGYCCSHSFCSCCVNAVDEGGGLSRVRTSSLVHTTYMHTHIHMHSPGGA